MYRSFKSIISRSLFLSLSLLPALMVAAEGDREGQNMGQRQGNVDQTNPSNQQDMMRDNQGAGTGWNDNQGAVYNQQGIMRGNPGAAYNQQSWSENQGTNYSYQDVRGNQGPAYMHQGWREDQGPGYHPNWDTHYSYGHPVEHQVYAVDQQHPMEHQVYGVDQQHYSGGYYNAPNDSQAGHSYSPGFHRVRGKYYSSANRSSDYRDGNYGNYPYSQSYPDDRGTGAGTVYFNVR